MEDQFCRWSTNSVAGGPILLVEDQFCPSGRRTNDPQTPPTATEVPNKTRIRSEVILSPALSSLDYQTVHRLFTNWLMPSSSAFLPLTLPCSPLLSGNLVAHVYHVRKRCSQNSTVLSCTFVFRSGSAGARFSAYRNGVIDYVVSTTHPDNPDIRKNEGGPEECAAQLRKVYIYPQHLHPVYQRTNVDKFCVKHICPECTQIAMIV